MGSKQGDGAAEEDEEQGITKPSLGDTHAKRGLDVGQCGGLNENGPHRFICLETWFPVGILLEKY